MSPATQSPMICPKCGATMNCHGEKRADPRTREDARYLDPVFGGVVLQTHSCPACGANASRLAN
jgi:ribosomal protein S27AE